MPDETRKKQDQEGANERTGQGTQTRAVQSFPGVTEEAGMKRVLFWNL